jgi:hypothetical protein
MTEPKETVDELRRRRNIERRERRVRAAQRQMLFYVLCVVGLGALYWYAQGDLTPTTPYAARARVVLEDAQRSMLREEDRSVVQPLSEGDRRHLERQRGIVEDLARRHVGMIPRGGSLGDLRILQSLIDDRVLQKDQVYELQALGVVLGDVLAEQLDLDWVIVEDQYGRTRALRFGTRDDLFFPVTMISKRYEKGIPVDVDDLYHEVEGDVARLQRMRS